MKQSESIRSHLYRRFDSLLQNIDQDAVKEYCLNWALVANYVNQDLESRSDLRDLIGPNPISVMHSNHACHINFLQSVFRLKSAKCLVEVVIWVYRSYIRRGFSPDYFPAELSAWKRGVSQYLEQRANIKSILKFYDGMLESHEPFLCLSKEEESSVDQDSRIETNYEIFMNSLLDGREQQAENILREHVISAATLPIWWETMVTPSLHRIGRLWADGKISVAQEHMATAIARRVMDRCFPRLPESNQRSGSVAVVVPPGEQHDIGAQMVRDCLELCGYNVLYTGADTPIESVVFLVRQNHLDTVLISTTMPYNLTATMDLIQAVRSSCPRVHIVVGGQAYLTDSSLADQVGADRLLSRLDEISDYLDEHFKALV